MFDSVGRNALYKSIARGNIEDIYKGNFVVDVNLPANASMNRTIETLNKYSAALEKFDFVENIVCVAGINTLGEGIRANGGTVFGVLKDWSERKEHLFDIFDMVENTAAEAIPETSVFAIGISALPGMDSAGAISMRLLDVQNHSDEELADLADKIEIAASKREELEDITKNFSVLKPYVDVRIDEDKAKLLGVNFDDVYSALRVNLSGDEVNDFTRFGHVYKVVLQAETGYRDSIDTTKFLFVRNADGNLVPLDTLITLTKTTGVVQISRYNGVRSVNFDGNVSEGFSTGQALDALEEVVEQVAPNTFQIEWSGQSRQEKLTRNSVVEVLALSLIFAFLCLVALYESWKIPFAVMLSVPTGIFGALLAEVVTRNLASVYMHIGILVLIGLAAKNAILIVEVAKVKVERGEEPTRAAIDANF